MRPPRSSVLLAVQHAALPASIEAAIELAKRLEAELVGLFVEDADLLRSAELPFARQVGLSTAADERLDLPRLKRELRILAQAARGELASRASASDVRWSFRVVRGHPDRELAVAAAESDIVVVPRSATRPGPTGAPRSGRMDATAVARCSVLFLNAETGLAGPVFVGFCESEAGERALHLAERLAGRAGVIVVLLSREELRERAGERLSPVRARVRFADVGTTSDLEQLLKSAGGGVLVGCRTDPWLTGEDVEAVVERVGIPLLLVSADARSARAGGTEE